MHGITLDALSSVDLVTATADVVASADEKCRHLLECSECWTQLWHCPFGYYKVADLSNGRQVPNADFIFPTNSSQLLWELPHQLERVSWLRLRL